MSVDELRSMLERHEPVTVLDVRNAADRAEWFIPGSLHIDVHDALWENDPRALADFIPPSSAPIVTVCGRGRTSILASRRLGERGIQARSLHGGMQAWSLAWNVAAIPLERTRSEVLQVRRTGKGCLSYVVGSKGVAAVIDPALDPSVYFDIAGRRGWKITHVLDTHVHADHLSRARALAKACGATVYLPEQRRVGYKHTPVRDGDLLSIGDAQLQVMATPGHTFESACYLLDRVALFTGDTLFLGTVGRPDLAAKADEETRNRARLLYRSLQRLVQLQPETLVLPGHTSEPIGFDGKPVGDRLGAVRERATVLALPEDQFVEWIVTRVPAPPANHLTIVQHNERGDLPDDPTLLEAGANRCAVG
jgi:glyoxylase-like metal-dependent hydrolase (beta-lactamase superfamily II)/rhodanese-related sulfurtransferase